VYQIRIKTAEMSRWALLDVNAGVAVKLSFYATLFNTKEEALAVIEKLKSINLANTQFKLRKAG
jgi:hypothetical protein